ncbi:MAG: zf-TFIIB domain-containing protein [Hallerella porci]|uniref:TFIIB-like protein n=1 Tax=Hallerella porci TaxID=1945871 RepID=A0ABX5LMK6_9BACT|nr:MULTISPECIES: zf-TFIIB domain-containing protein [Hallerella]MCI5601816.1 zf-TFIIB domain-containing protein [Hallerella sp.]MDY3921821.1 zf-TFIIB domain-containing protein [Hallerella porci]PWK95565.1 TFIIB-like protein [Hallerella porci]
MSQCPFCKSETKKVELSRFDLRICPHCLGTFFPSDKTMAFRREVYDKTRELWLKALEERNADWVEADENSVCIDHGEKLVDGKLPDYGIPGKVASCCEMFQLPASTMHTILRRMVGSPSDEMFLSSKQKHHFGFIVFLSKIVDKIFGSGAPEEDAFETMQYKMKFQEILEKPAEK